MRVGAASLLAVMISLSACGHRKNHSPVPSVSEVEKASLQKPVDCATARRDIATLEDEKASVGRRALAGIRSVVPFSAAAGILLGDYSDRVEVATGKYNEALEKKIQEIRATCSIPDQSA